LFVWFEGKLLNSFTFLTAAFAYSLVAVLFAL